MCQGHILTLTVLYVTRPESGLDGFMCAIFAPQRKFLEEAKTHRNHLEDKDEELARFARQRRGVYVLGVALVSADAPVCPLAGDLQVG